MAVLLVAVVSAGCQAHAQYPLPDIEDAKFVADCVRAHNSFRSRVTPPASNMLLMVRRPSRAAWGVMLLWCWLSLAESAFALCFFFPFLAMTSALQILLLTGDRKDF